ncbi:hypothetical protein [Cupriavidus basilensis]|uniref:hypothetical protein n=1 Tax=Cupriavidus basilensis TaxID=68895 RepID=UPI0020A6388E|nr:hypothetical protein [Cupriavidus basilensis]
MPSATPNHAINARSSSESLIDRIADFPDGEMCGKRLCVSRYRPVTGRYLTFPAMHRGGPRPPGNTPGSGAISPYRTIIAQTKMRSL